MKITKRLEFKYRISYKDYHMIKPVLETLLQSDQHSKTNAYPITSIYLDDIYHSGAMDKAFGNQYHKKYRLRHYRDESNIKLECKEKVGNETTKMSSTVSPDLAEAIQEINLDVLEQHFDDQLIRRFTLDAMRYHYEPRATILYEREAFVDPSENLRVTFDHRIQAAPAVTKEDRIFIDLMQASHLILEVKYEHFLPKEIKQLLSYYKLTQLSVSKYFLGYQQITP